MLFGIWLRVGLLFGNCLAEFSSVERPLVRDSLFQRKIVCDAKYPAAKIGPRSSELKVAEERQKDLLNHLFRVMHGDSEGKRIAQQGIAKLLKESNHLAFDLRRTR